MRRIAILIVVSVFARVMAALPTKEEPVGLLLSAGGTVVRANTETELPARVGDVLFAGDAIRAQSAPAAFLYCPGKSSQTLLPGGDVVLESKQLRVKAGQLADQKTVRACFLPQVVRVAAASQQHYGVSMTRGLGEAIEPTPADKLPAEVVAELAPIDKALVEHPNDAASMVARATVFERHNLLANAVVEYKKIGGEWKDAVWVRQKIFELEQALATAATEAAAKPIAGGQTLALVVGISRYRQLPQPQWLQYADVDAEEFAKHLMSPRGGALPPGNLVLLTNEQATTAALRITFQNFLKARAGKKDTVFLLIAGHGVVETEGSRGAYILTYDSDPQDLASTALGMVEIQDLMQEHLSKVARVAVFVDVCRSGMIGAIRSTTINGTVERLAEAPGEIFGLTASRPKELSHEGPEFGGGHGAFTYYLLKALSGEADQNKDNIVNVNEVIDYVREQVAKGTSNKQHPRDFGTMDNAVPLSDVSKPGIKISRRPLFLDSSGPLVASLAFQLPSGQINALRTYNAALEAKRLLPDEPGSAFAVLPELEKALPTQQYIDQVNRLRIAVENRAQQAFLEYIGGDQVPQTRAEFEAGAKYVRAAVLLTPESLYLQARDHFFRGRLALFDKQYNEAIELFERSIELDSRGSYAFQSLGCTYMERHDLRRAAAAFRDAISRSPYWAYPLNRLSLNYVESGNLKEAERGFKRAMKLTPACSYLPFNLGEVYLRLDKRKNAEAAFRRAISIDPNSLQARLALADLLEKAGKRDAALEQLREAQKREPNNPAILEKLKGRQP